MFDNIKVFKTKIVKPRIKHQCVKCEGYHGTSLKTVHAAKAWAKNKIVNPPKQ